jgi:hypothetical protein
VFRADRQHTGVEVFAASDNLEEARADRTSTAGFSDEEPAVGLTVRTPGSWIVTMMSWPMVWKEPYAFSYNPRRLVGRIVAEPQCVRPAQLVASVSVMQYKVDPANGPITLSCWLTTNGQLPV